MENSNHQINNKDILNFKDSLISDLLELKPNLGLTRNKRKLFLLLHIIDYVVENISMEIQLDEIATDVGASKFEICRLFNEYLESSPMRWLWDVRIQFAKEYIAIAPHWSLTDISHACGFNSLAHFSRSFSKAHGVTPLKYKTSFEPQHHQADCYQLIYGNKCESLRRSIVLRSFR
ncbi:AraC family transcriptional regulator [Vibrio parahaemolyticus]|nr:AraC family transcriptional regulator [Vibrio parahaemolyticus]